MAQQTAGVFRTPCSLVGYMTHSLRSFSKLDRFDGVPCSRRALSVVCVLICIQAATVVLMVLSLPDLCRDRYAVAQTWRLDSSHSRKAY